MEGRGRKTVGVQVEGRGRERKEGMEEEGRR
jgi:hypothetical protein